MRKICALALLLLTIALAAEPSKAAYVSLRGIRVDVPAGWTVESGEEMIIYNKNQSAVVIISTMSQNFESSFRDVVKNLGQSVGVPKKDIRHDGQGSAMLQFTQDGELVRMRLFEEGGRIMMVCTMGADGQADRIAASVTTKGAHSHHRPAASTQAPSNKTLKHQR